MKKISVCFLMTSVFYSFCFGQNSYEIFKEGINEKLDLLSSYSYPLDEDNVIDFNPDSLLSAIAEEITRYLKAEGFTHFRVEDFPLLEYQKDENNPFETLIIGYNCGGTAGWIPHSIIIKHTQDKPLIYNIEAESYFYEYHRLKDELYLCIGSSPGSGICRGYSVFAIDFSKDAPQFNPVFNGEYAFYICNSDISYVSEENMLLVAVDFLPYKDEDKTYKDYLDEHGYTYFSVEYDSEEDEQDYAVIFKSKFDGLKFVKP